MNYKTRELITKGSMRAIDFIAACIEDSRRIGASDIHIDPRERDVVVRIRHDGVLEELCRYDLVVHIEVIACLKIMSNLRLDEHYIPQDGRIHIETPEKVDMRIVVTPSYFGEAAVLRLLRSYQTDTTLESLGFEANDAALLSQRIQSGTGLYIIAGPTGSGKTTTLYALLSELVSPEYSVITIEDPIEYIFPGTRQIAVNNNTHFRFAEGLRSVLRQDPDVIVVGEIRDAETARIAISAALTGHKVMATIHTTSALGVRTRFVDMGIDQYMIDATLRVAIAQKLVRKLCDECKFKKDEETYVSAGCDTCSGKGFSGRIAVYEIWTKNECTPSCVDDGIKKAKMGIVALEDVMALSCV